MYLVHTHPHAKHTQSNNPNEVEQMQKITKYRNTKKYNKKQNIKEL